jgi:hypothetical protein
MFVAMVPHWKRRVVAAPLALWFLVSAIDSDRLHACPVHGSHASATQAPSHAHHGIAATASGPSSATSSRGHHDHGRQQCTCPGDCCGPAPFAAIAPPVAVADANVVATAAPVFPLALALPAGDCQLALPPSIGPPALLA